MCKWCFQSQEKCKYVTGRRVGASTNPIGLKQNWLLRKTIQDAFESQHLHLTRKLTSETGNECLIEEQVEELKQDQVIKIPTENRSQYEKLSSTQEEFSSDDEMGTKESRKKLQKHHVHHKTKPGNIIQNLKPQHALKVSKTMVLAKKNKLHSTFKKTKILQNFEQNDNNKKSQEKEERGDSDDSIGSASDLRDVDEVSDGGQFESEIESLDVPSVYTCGSSVYHAECESMTASNTFETRRRKKVVKEKETTIKSEEEEEEEEGEGEQDHISQQCDKPLLDEFDSDNSPQFWDTPWDNETKDVFAMAPFQRPENDTRKKKNSRQNDLVSFSPEKLKRDLLTFSESDSQHEDKVIETSKSPNLIILSGSDSDLKKTQDTEETQTLLTNQTQDSHLLKDVTVTETLHLVREKLKPLEKLEEKESYVIGNEPNPDVADNPSFYEDNRNNTLFSDDDDEKFPTRLHGFSPKLFQPEKFNQFPEENKDIFGFSPFPAEPTTKNPFEGDDFQPEINEKNEVYQYFSTEKSSFSHSTVGNYEVSTNLHQDLSPPVLDDNKLLSPSNFDECTFIKNMNEKESKVHFSLGDKILNFKSDKKYDSLKHEEKLKKKFEEKISKIKNCDKNTEKCKKHKSDKKIERGFSNMSFEDCLSGEECKIEESPVTSVTSVEAKVKKLRPLQRLNNPFT